ncbi:hypothetical protein MRB53_014657 [Persea americana]|uniref:Uncharacterized protein n=1 Tax=Persea americana TaxID=3435 RepID=A0ACC2KBT0_PERAE|nr:hypothetical protein MRB53_014657 [Persea americana]
MPLQLNSHSSPRGIKVSEPNITDSPIFPLLWISASHNALTGPIWQELGQLRYLLVLDLGLNNLSSIIPEELSGMRNVGALDLSHNNLSGTIPPSLVYLSF